MGASFSCQTPKHHISDSVYPSPTDGTCAPNMTQTVSLYPLYTNGPHEPHQKQRYTKYTHTQKIFFLFQTTLPYSHVYNSPWALPFPLHHLHCLIPTHRSKCLESGFSTRVCSALLRIRGRIPPAGNNPAPGGRSWSTHRPMKWSLATICLMRSSPPLGGNATTATQISFNITSGLRSTSSPSPRTSPSSAPFTCLTLWWKIKTLLRLETCRLAVLYQKVHGPCPLI